MEAPSAVPTISTTAYHCTAISVRGSRTTDTTDTRFGVLSLLQLNHERPANQRSRTTMHSQYIDSSLRDYDDVYATDASSYVAIKKNKQNTALVVTLMVVRASVSSRVSDGESRASRRWTLRRRSTCKPPDASYQLSKRLLKLTFY